VADAIHVALKDAWANPSSTYPPGNIFTFAECGRLCFDRCVFFLYFFIFYMHVISTHNSKSIQPNRMTFGRMISYYPMDM
jgi:hypothetical protein